MALRQRQTFAPADLQRLLAIESAAAERLLQALIEQGYLQPMSPAAAAGRAQWQLSVQGARFAWASTAPPITRPEAEAILERFLARVRSVPTDDRFLFAVRQVIVFGSFVGDADELHDIDLVVKARVKQRFNGDFGTALRDALERISAQTGAIKSPRHWQRLVLDDMLQHLRVSPYLSIHPQNQLEVIEQADRARGVANPGTPHRVVYDDPGVVSARPAAAVNPRG